MDIFYWIAVAVVATLGSARITRLLTFDKFPPVLAVRNWLDDKFDGKPVQLLWHCGYCMGVWVAGLTILSADFMGVLTGTTIWDSNGYFASRFWFYSMGWMALSYATAIVMAYDGDTSGADD